MTKPSDRLTDKQRLFAQEYVKDLNATAAYQRAGYTATTNAARTNASRLLTNADVQAYIRELQQGRSLRTQITADRVLEEVARVAFSNITDVASFDEGGVKFANSLALNDDVKAAIAQVSSKKTITHTREGPEETVNLSVKMHNKMDALKQLMTYLGLTNDFNVAMSTLEKYGLQLRQTDKHESGWEVVKLDESTPAAS